MMPVSQAIFLYVRAYIPTTMKHTSGTVNPAAMLSSPASPMTTGDTAPPTIDMTR